MSERVPFEYVIVRVVPRVDRGECVNAGVILICRPKRFLAAQVDLDRMRLQALDPSLSAGTIQTLDDQLRLIPLIASGESTAGPLARLDMGERWHLLSALSSTMLQPSPVHTGLCFDPLHELDQLFSELVETLPLAGNINARE